MHNARVFRRSRIGQSLIRDSNTAPIIPPGRFLVGDTGYPSNINILLPYPSVATRKMNGSITYNPRLALL
ncbi:hypothetical protein PSTT_12959 [Puccinia striiformis]|uniref:DDE Tnp4 domain-containing protein n=1 Tax=Puccinia striiformis TaxID=27350 RepID=A0A2S4UTT1_9BASI|nr:hypothetical protein PSTT_12959 [Puccinia striiformis]